MGAEGEGLLEQPKQDTKPPAQLVADLVQKGFRRGPPQGALNRESRGQARRQCSRVLSKKSGQEIAGPFSL